MSTLLTSSPEIPTLADLLERLGGISAERVRYYPMPGTATVADVEDILEHGGRVCELIDGVLVEKAVGFRESILAGAILAALRAFVVPRRLGYVAGEAGLLQLTRGLVRGPDVSFVMRSRFPEGMPVAAVPLLVPDLAVEVLSKSNTKREMERKRRDYFESGVRLVWIVDPNQRTIAVYTAQNATTQDIAAENPAADQRPQILDPPQTLDGGAVLPGFTLELGPLFAELDQ